MDSSLLATKVRVPPQMHHLVRRARLVDILERKLPEYKLALISAPPGYGKTTLLAQWAEVSRFPVAWFSVGEEDSDAERFFRYLLLAWEAVQPGVRESPLGLLLGATEPDREAVLSAFVNVATDVSTPMVFVLDDYHLIGDPSVHQALTFVLDHLPASVRFVLAGREEPPLPLARYRARQELLEIQAEELQFSVEETEAFLNGLTGLELSEAELVNLQTQLEGWIAGLQLVSLSLRRHRGAAEGLVVSGRHRFIADYLSDEVLARQPEETQRFLLQTSLLDRLCGPLCDAVTGREGSQLVLARLERAHLFLERLDDQREWFRYHRLFADFLQDELRRHRADEVAELHRRAARWYLAHGSRDPAFRHAVAGDDVELGFRIFDRYLNEELTTGGARTVQRWLDAVPESWYAVYPVFGLAQAGLLLTSGAFEAGIRRVDEVEHRLAQIDRDDTRWQRARVTAVRCFIACFQNDLTQAVAYADQALRDLEEEQSAFRDNIFQALGDTYRRNGFWEQARSSYLKVLDVERVPRSRLQAAHVYGALADLELMQGRLRAAAAYWDRALVIIEERQSWGRLPLAITGWVYLRMGELRYEWNELETARDHLTRGLQRAELGGDVLSLIAGYLIGARLKLTDGDIAAAASALERARPLLERASFPDWSGRFERCQLELWFAQDQLRAAVEWADAEQRDDAGAATPERESTQLALSRVLIVKGDATSCTRALSLLHRLLPGVEAAGRRGIQIEALALQALASWVLGDRVSAMTSLEHALRLAEPEGYVRLFADLGLPMARLLQEARARQVMPEYVERILAAIGTDLALPGAPGGTLPEPLSDRERDVLGLLAAGLTNREIADALFISPETVKKHTGSIYGKLGVGNRTEAAAKARVLHLLD